MWSGNGYVTLVSMRNPSRFPKILITLKSTEVFEILKSPPDLFEKGLDPSPTIPHDTDMKKTTPNQQLSVEGYRNYRNEPRVELRYMDRTIILTEEQAEQLALAILDETSKFKEVY